MASAVQSAPFFHGRNNGLLKQIHLELVSKSKPPGTSLKSTLCSAAGAEAPLEPSHSLDVYSSSSLTISNRPCAMAQNRPSLHEAGKPLNLGPRICTLSDLDKRSNVKSSGTIARSPTLCSTNMWTFADLDALRRLADLTKPDWSFRDTQRCAYYCGSLTKLLQRKYTVERIDLLSCDFTDTSLSAIADARSRGKLPHLQNIRVIIVPNASGPLITQAGINQFNKDMQFECARPCSYRERWIERLLKEAEEVFFFFQDENERPIKHMPLRSLGVFRFAMEWAENAPFEVQRELAELLRSFTKKLSVQARFHYSQMPYIRAALKSHYIAAKRENLLAFLGKIQQLAPEYLRPLFSISDSH